MPNESKNCYQGCIESWKIDLIAARLKAFRISADHHSDLTQNLVTVLLNFRYRPRNEGQACESTVVYQIITHHLTSWVRSRKREQHRMERHRQRLGLCTANAEHHAYFTISSNGDMEFDIRESLAELAPAERQICELLMTGASVRDIAKQTRLSWHGVSAGIKRIRTRFSEMELHAWLTK